ncbi:MAG: hypothetical protein AB8I69_12795 [Anaerolineae bacterium]|jgi:hypothetical protein
MTKGHKLLVGSGAAVIVAILLIAAFSLGVYVGEHGFTRGDLTLRSPDPGVPAQPPRVSPGAPAQQPPVNANRPPDVTGRIRQNLGESLLLATPDGPRTIELNDQTQVRTLEGEQRHLDALKPGQPVAIFGHLNGDGRVLVAESIILLPPAQQPIDQPPQKQP